MLPYINKIQKTRDFQTQFLGLNHTDNCADGEFYDMNNLSSDLYPILSTRGADLVVPKGGNGDIKAMLMKEELCIVKGKDLFVGDNIVEDFISPVKDEADKEIPITLVSMGAYLLIFPQNLYVNTKNLEERGSMKEAFYADYPHLFLYCYLSDQNGKQIFPNVEGEYPSTQYDAEQAGLSYYVDILGDEPRLMKKYTEGEAVNWNVTNDCYVAIATTPSVESEGKDAMFGDRFPTDSVVLLSEFPEDLLYDANLNGQKTVFKHLYEGDDEFTAQGDAILVQGVIASNFAVGRFKIERVIPKMDHVVESNNRIWGCRYGKNEKGEQVNEIFSSALGDFKQWYKYGTESGSHFEGVGTDGPFTGAITYAGNPIFFKERYYHRVTGYSPSDFHVQTSAMPGVQNGANKSLAIANNLLFYKGVDGIYVYDGTTPEMISKKLGNPNYRAIAAGGHKHKYYVFMQYVSPEIAESATFVFDTKLGLWHKYDMPAEHFESDGETLYFSFKNHLERLSNEDFSIGKNWYAETGVIGRETPDKKYITKLNIRASIKQFSRVIFYIEYDSNGRWLPVGILEGRTLQSFSLPIKLYRCDHFRIRMEGTGPVKIHSMSKTMIEGSDE